LIQQIGGPHFVMGGHMTGLTTVGPHNRCTSREM
jgi:hypothetical protein